MPVLPGARPSNFRAAEVLLETAGLPIYITTDHDLHQREASAARELLGEQAWTAAHDEGRAMNFEEAVEYALDEDEALLQVSTH